MEKVGNNLKKRVSSIDVAKEAGVSRATVSYVVNNTKNVSISSQTRKKVLDAVKKLGYHPDAIARALRTNKSMTIGVVSKRNIAEERFSRVLEGVNAILKSNGYSILLCSDEITDKGFPEYYCFYREKKIDGVIVLSYMEMINKKEIEKAASIVEMENIPAVFIDFHINNPMVNCVDINYYHGGYIAAEYLIKKGHKKIIYIEPGIYTVQEAERKRGVIKAFEDNGYGSRMINICNMKFPEVDMKLHEIIKNRGDYTALIASWIHYGLRTMYIVHKLDIKVPKEFAVVSLAGSKYADLCYPQLATSNLPLYEAGRKSAMILLENIKQVSIPVNILLPCSLSIN